MSFLPFPPSALRFLARLNEAGFEGYLVGGCVRDALRGVIPPDYAVCTSARPEETAAVFSDCRIVPTGIRHGTVTVLFENISFETTTFRSDIGYSDGRHPDSVQFTNDLDSDLSRRDFTMNAVAWNPAHGFIDPFHGGDAIRNRQIICVGDPDKRFEEDALRTLRAVRFYSTLCFSITASTADAIRRKAGLITKISGERIRDEAEKILLSGRATDGIRLLLSYFWGSLFGEEAFRLEPCFPIEEFASDINLRTAVFLLKANDPESILRRFRCSSSFISNVLQILKVAKTDYPATPAGARRFCHATSLPLETASLSDALHPDRPALLPYVREVVWSKNRYALHISDLAVSGDDLIRAGIPEGKEVGQILSALMDLVLEEPEKNTVPFLLEEAKKIRGDS